MSLKWCPGYTSDGAAGETYSQERHQLEDDSAKGAANKNFGPQKSQCRECYAVYARDWRAKRKVGGAVPARRTSTAARGSTVVFPDFRAPAMEAAVDEDGEFVSDEDLATSRSHAYVPIAGLIEKWGAVTNDAAEGNQPFVLMFLGPSGCGKTEAGEYLATLVGLPFTKVDGASMMEAESWFGTREVVSEDGVSVTAYRPSTFVLAIEQPGVLLIDEVNRTPDGTRNVLNPLFDNTHQVTNPLTGDVVKKHPRCFVIMTGNRGLGFTGTYAIDPSLMTRALVVEFDYAPPAAEAQIAAEASGCDQETADLFVRYAGDVRARALTDQDYAPMSTREVINACKLVKRGLSPDDAIRMVLLDGASPEGAASSVRAGLEALWTGVRKAVKEVPIPCGAEHPTEVDAVGDPLTCGVECTKDQVALAKMTGGHRHPDNPQHQAKKDIYSPIVTWF